MENKTNCISKSELPKMNAFQIIDVRTNEEFINQHIPNAIHIPLEKLEGKLTELPKNKFYITTCGKGGNRSIKGTEILLKNNFQANWLCKGTFGWFE